MTRPRWRIQAARVVFVAVLATQVGFAINGYLEPHKYFAFQPFNESSTWRAEIVRVTTDGDRIPITEPWPGGYDWDELVDWGVLEDPGHEGVRRRGEPEASLVLAGEHCCVLRGE